MTPNLAFLRKVADGKVYPWASYSKTRGRLDCFRGGRKTALRHEEAGFVKITPPPGVMRSGKVTLTEKGKAALDGRPEALD